MTVASCGSPGPSSGSSGKSSGAGLPVSDISRDRSSYLLTVLCFYRVQVSASIGMMTLPSGSTSGT